VTVVTDERGIATATLRADSGVPFQIATIRATDVTTGAFRLSTFFIRQPTVAGAEFTTVPTEWVSTGTYKNECPGGVVDFLIFGGTPPYTIRSSNPSIGSVTPTVTNVENPSRFSVQFNASTACTGYNILYTVTDANGLTTVPKLTVIAGTVDRPAPAPTLLVTPTSLTLQCNQTGQALATVLNATTTTPVITASLGTAVGSTTALVVTVNTDGLITVSRGTGTVAASLSSPALITIGSGSAPHQTLSVFTQPSC
jgi:hypothetical protein